MSDIGKALGPRFRELLIVLCGANSEWNLGLLWYCIKLFLFPHLVYALTPLQDVEGLCAYDDTVWRKRNLMTVELISRLVRFMVWSISCFQRHKILEGRMGRGDSKSGRNSKIEKLMISLNRLEIRYTAH